MEQQQTSTLRSGIGYDTKILTREHGLVSVGDYVGQDVTVLDGDGRWAVSSIWAQGRYLAHRVDLTNTSGVINIETMTNHTWLIEGSDAPVRTDQLKGDGSEELQGLRDTPWKVSGVTTEGLREMFFVVVPTTCSLYGENGVLLRT